MIRIGDFARIAGISVATLRLYDEEGLLSPCFVSPDSGYRHYGPDQLQDVNRILVLKALGFSLPEVRSLLLEPQDPAEMRRLLAKKREAAQARLEADLAQIRRIECRISMIEKEQTMPHLEVAHKTVPAMTLAAIRLVVPTNDQVPSMLGDAYDRLFKELAELRISPKGPALAIWYSSPKEHSDEVVDAAVEIDPASTEPKGAKLERLPQTEVASVVHTGSFSEFQQCHVALSEWMAEHGYRLDGAYREIYHSCGPDQATTEVQYPIAED